MKSKKPFKCTDCVSGRAPSSAVPRAAASSATPITAAPANAANAADTANVTPTASAAADAQTRPSSARPTSSAGPTSTEHAATAPERAATAASPSASSAPSETREDASSAEPMQVGELPAGTVVLELTRGASGALGMRVYHETNVVEEVKVRGAAHQAGVQVGDRIVAVNGRLISRFQTFAEVLPAGRLGSKLGLGVIRPVQAAAAAGRAGASSSQSRSAAPVQQPGPSVFDLSVSGRPVPSEVAGGRGKTKKQKTTGGARGPA